MTTIRYAITNRNIFAGNELQKMEALVRQAERWAGEGIAYIQLREKTLAASCQARLARAILNIGIREGPRLLINSRADIAIAVRAHGVHLTSDRGGLTPKQVRQLYNRAGLPRPIVSRSCHTPAEAINARNEATDLILFGPVFGKIIGDSLVVPGTGLALFAEVCRVASPIPVLALGGVGPGDADACARVGGAGISGIRTFLHAEP